MDEFSDLMTRMNEAMEKRGLYARQRGPVMGGFVNSIGQSGTHMVSKLLSELGLQYMLFGTIESVGKTARGKRAWEFDDFDPRQHILTGVEWPSYIHSKDFAGMMFDHGFKPPKFGASHMFYTPAAHRTFLETGIRMVLITRNAKDWITSVAHAVVGSNPEHKRDGVAETINRYILGREPEGPDQIGILPMVERYQLMSEWTGKSCTLTIRFEDLIGPAGGGDRARQLKCIDKVADHVNAAIPPLVRDLIADGLFGGTATFRSGQVNGWKQYEDLLTPYMKLLNRADEVLQDQF